QAVLGAGVRELECLLDVGGAGEQRRGRRAEGARQLAHRDLGEAAIVDPDAVAVADDHLVDGLVVDPAEPARPLESEAALRLLAEVAVAVVDPLLEAAARGLRALGERLEALDRSSIYKTTCTN